MKNKYIKTRTFLGEKRGAIIRCFSLDKFYTSFRERIYRLCEAESLFENGETEPDESHFGARRVCGKRGRGALGKTPVFGMLKRGDKVYTKQSGIVQSRSYFLLSGIEPTAVR